MREFVVDVPLYQNRDDFTIYLDPKKLDDERARELASSGGSIEVPITVRDGTQKLAGRALLCYCRGKQQVSLSIRLSAKPPKAASRPVTVPPVWRSRFESDVSEEEPGGRLVPLAALRDVLYKILFLRPGEAAVRQVPAGVLVIAGRTGSAKSKIARGLIAKLLTDLPVEHRASRRPHLITLEDPIEVPYYRDGNRRGNMTRQDRAVDYTPRDLSRGDCPSLARAFRDALRQTPTVVYVGEVRADDDWRAVLDFAGTGHLVVVTTHSGSVSETFSKIFRATAADSPANWGFIARKVLGVVHQATISSAATGRSGLIPTVWRRTDAGIAALITVGLSSILPHYPRGDEIPEETSSVGRRWFVEKLIKTDERANCDLAAFGNDLTGI